MSIRCMMDGIQLLIIWCAAFICGKNEVSSCEVEINVQRGTTKYVSPGQSLTVKCPIKHCGTFSNVIWCKFSDTNHCGNITKTENIEIREENKGTKLVSYLKFKQVSINDEGLYQCSFGHSVSHVTNISVSDRNKGVENPENIADNHDDDDDDGSSWLHYFIICFSIGLSITAVIAFTLICFSGWKETCTCNNKNQEQEISTHIPELSRNSSPTLRTQFTLRNDIYSSSTGEGTTSMSPALNHSGNRQTAANTAANTQASSSALYAIINHQQFGAQPRNFTCKNDEKTNYAVINVP